MSFEGTGLDPRLLRALSKRGFEKPTPVQAECIPKALEGRDLVARARTGSGKTLAYLLPALQKILTGGKGKAGWQAVVLVPTRELCEQVKEEAAAVASQCGAGLVVSAINGEGSGHRSQAATAGQLVVTTPAKIAQMLQQGWVTGEMLEQRLQVLVLDEADLLLSYGYEEDVQLLAPQIPRACQCLLMSATTSDDVDRLTKLVLHNPLSLNLLSAAPEGAAAAGAAGAAAGGAAAEIAHFRLDMPAGCGGGRGEAGEAAEKLLHLLALLKLGVVQRKVLVFVNSADAGMRVRLFLEAFGVRAAVLNAELPLNSRHHILQEFNKGLFDYLIAADDVHASLPKQLRQQQQQQEGEGMGTGKKKGRKRGRQQQKDEEFGVTRGIDFKGVSTVVNFDMPASVQGYVHRVGRTGRAGQSGTAISLLGPSDLAFAAELDAELAAQQPGTQPGDAAGAAGAGGGDTEGAAEGEGSQGASGASQKFLRPFSGLTRAAVEGLRYRGEDVARSITRNVIKEARAKELKQELLNSQRLADFFEEHPSDLNLLKHDRPLAATQAAGAAVTHLKHIPAYLRDPSLQGVSHVGNRGRGVLPHKKRRKAEGVDPVRGFAKAPRRGGHLDEDVTELERRAAEKAGKKGGKRGGAGFQPKRNVRKGKSRKR